MTKCPDKTLEVGTVIQDKWVILEFIAKGGMGEVYRAHQVNLKRDVAFKIISREWLASLEDNEEEMEAGLQRFRNEVVLMAQIRHQNVLQIYDHGSFSTKKGEEILSLEYIAMEYIPGGTLRSTMSEEGFYPEEDLVRNWIITYFLPILDGVQTLHSGGIIHRDLKPGNILMDGNVPKIADFGVARSSRIRPITTSRDMKGTPPYMSPEHFMDLKRVDNRADIYSLGKILYEAIDGKIGPDTIPFKSASLKKTETPFFQELDRIIRKATEEDRNSRFGSAEEFQAAILDAVKATESHPKIKSAAQSEPSRTHAHRKPVLAGAASALILALATALWLFFGWPGNQSDGLPTNSYDAKPLDPSVSSQASTPASATTPSLITGRDGARLHKIPGGLFPLKDSSGQETRDPVNIGSFFMDETEVTNHQFVEFLNKVLSRIHVEGELVKEGGRLWIVLGEVGKGYEPIVFKDGKFVVKDALYHSHPVVRVTAFGAAAYAEYYGRRLPSAEEWLYALKSGDGTKQASLGDHMEMMREQVETPSKMPVSVTDSPPDKHGIRGLQGNVDEWGITTPKGLKTQASKGNHYAVLPESVSRGPWEAFEDVGFRTALDAS